MKKLGIVILALIFGLTLFTGQSFARGEKEHETSGAMDQRSGMMGEQTEWQSRQTSQINRASEFIGKTVKNQQGEELGELEEVVFDTQGNINYIVLSRGGVLGMGGELTPIPWRSANANFHEDSLVINMEKQRLDNAPSFSEWNNLNEQQFQQEVRGYYGQESEMGQDFQHQEGTRYDQREGTQFDEDRKEKEKY